MKWKFKKYNFNNNDSNIPKSEAKKTRKNILEYYSKYHLYNIYVFYKYIVSKIFNQ